MAIEDAGLKPRDVDGVATWFHGQPDTPSAQELASAMELDCRYELFASEGGHWLCAAVMTAAAAVFAGMCRHVLVYIARNGYSEGRARRGHDRIASGPDQF